MGMSSHMRTLTTVAPRGTERRGLGQKEPEKQLPSEAKWRGASRCGRAAVGHSSTGLGKDHEPQSNLLLQTEGAAG